MIESINQSSYSPNHRESPPLTDREAIEKISRYLKEYQPFFNEEFIDIQKKILKRYRWSLDMEETIPTVVLKGLHAFANQKSDNIKELIDWSDLVSHPPPLSFFIKKFNLSNMPESGKLKIFLERMAILIQENRIYVDKDIEGYVHILIHHQHELQISDIAPLVNYLSYTDFVQFPIVIKEALKIKGMQGANFLKLFFSLANDFPFNNIHVEEAMEIFFLNESTFLDSIFSEQLFHLLVDKKNHSFIGKIFNKFIDETLLQHRIVIVLKKIIENEDFRFFNLINLITKSRRLVTLFFQKQSLSAKEIETLITMVSAAYGLSSVKEELNIHLFNPIFYDHIEEFSHVTEEEIQDDLLSIFFNIIKRSDPEDHCEEMFKRVSQLFKLLISRFYSAEIFDGKSREFLKHFLNQFKQMTAIEGCFKQKLILIERVINPSLDLKLEYIGRLSRKGNLNILYKNIEKTFEGIVSIEDLEIKVSRFENSFLHQLFAQVYSDDDFKDWFSNENPHIQQEKIKNILANMEKKRKVIEETYIDILKENSFEYIHNNQIGALSTLETQIEYSNVFLKLGTGQGKSFIAEMAAIDLLSKANPPNRVFIFTSYDHLAKRDYENMKFLSSSSKFPSYYLSGKNSFSVIKDEIKSAKIIHLDSEIFQSFLTASIGEILNGKGHFSELMEIFFSQEHNAVILDEGDLMILDDPKHEHLYSFSEIFGQESIDMDTQKEQFVDLLGEKIVDDLNQFFPGCFNQWYSQMTEFKHGKSSTTYVASGKTTTFAGSFSHRIQQGIYQFSPLLFNFSAYVRSFGRVLFLSGSINKENINAFDRYFTNKKENFYATIPFFFGSDNRCHHLMERKKLQKLDLEQWYDKIAEDVAEAQERGQPVLLFGASIETLENIKEKLKKKGEKYHKYWTTIFNEETLNSNFKLIGKPDTLAFATTIAGRGIDVKISQEIELGLHVIVTELPENNNERLLEQMIGRTARLDRKGSVSMIVKENLDEFYNIANNKRKISIVNEDLISRDYALKLLTHFFNQEKQLNPILVKRWLILLQLISYRLVDLSNKQLFEKAIQFVGVSENE